jgi:hypothetical protein
LTGQAPIKSVKTDHLIDLLSATLEPVGGIRFGRTLLAAILTGAAVAFALMWATVGPRPDLDSTIHLAWTAAKVLFTISVTATATPLLLKSMQPGLDQETQPALLLLPFFAVISIALPILLSVTPETRSLMLRGATSLSPVRCLLCTIFFAAVPFAALIWTVRRGAPTQLRLTGAIAGVVAGGLGAAAYSFACRSDTIPFIAICYSAAIALCALIGAQLAPRLLRW